MLTTLLTSTAFGSAVVFGFRHGFDWDHLAALTDLTGSQVTARRSMFVATLYALGHALMVLVLGIAAIVFADQLPASVDGAMERLVGVSLVALGVWIVVTAVRTRGAPPLRSRWMVLIGAVRGAIARRRPSTEPVVVIEHAHPHDHDGRMHEHPHGHGADPALDQDGAPVAVAVQHSHLHRHVVTAPLDPLASYSGPSAFGIGMVHGVGAETPTQVLIFAAAANADGRASSVAVLVCFLAGLVGANTLVAAASTLGFRRVLTRPSIAVALAAVTAAFSLVVGTLLLTGHGGALPPFPGSG